MNRYQQTLFVNPRDSETPRKVTGNNISQTRTDHHPRHMPISRFVSESRMPNSNRRAMNTAVSVVPSGFNLKEYARYQFTIINKALLLLSRPCFTLSKYQHVDLSACRLLRRVRLTYRVIATLPRHSHHRRSLANTVLSPNTDFPQFHSQRPRFGSLYPESRRTGTVQKPPFHPQRRGDRQLLDVRLAKVGFLLWHLRRKHFVTDTEGNLNIFFALPQDVSGHQFPARLRALRARGRAC